MRSWAGKTDEWTDGNTAYLRGRPLSNNPYIMHGTTGKWGRWRQGWLDAQQAKIDKRQARRKRLQDEMGRG